MKTFIKVLAGITLAMLLVVPVSGIFAATACGTPEAACTTPKPATTEEPGCDNECRILPKLPSSTSGGTTGGSGSGVNDEIGGVKVVEPPDVDETEMMNIIKRIVNWIFTALMFFVVVMVLIAGFYFVTGGGNPDNVTKARNMLMFALVGFAVGMLSRGVIALVAVFLGQDVPQGGLLD